MPGRPMATIRPFAPADAEGILAVDRATFDDCPYDADQVRELLAAGPLQAWVADAAGAVAGFVVALPTHAVRGLGWEVDLLAVHPDYRGQGLATALVQAAVDAAPPGVLGLRAVVGTRNAASARAFRRAGFQAEPTPRRLLIYFVRGREPRPAGELAVPVHIQPAAGAASLLLLAGEEGRAELLPVQTLLYRGGWIETLSASTAAARAALIHTLVEHTKAEGWDEVGCLVPEPAEWAWRHALVAAGFHDEGEYRVLVRPPETTP